MRNLTRFPFVQCSICKEVQESVACLQNLLSVWPGVKDVHPEQQVKRSLTWDSNSNHHVQEQSQATTDTEWVQKRPGRYVIPASRTPHLASTLT